MNTNKNFFGETNYFRKFIATIKNTIKSIFLDDFMYAFKKKIIELLYKDYETRIMLEIKIAT